MIRPYYASKSSAEMMHAMALKTTSVTTVWWTFVSWASSYNQITHNTRWNKNYISLPLPIISPKTQTVEIEIVNYHCQQKECSSWLHLLESFYWLFYSFSIQKISIEIDKSMFLSIDNKYKVVYLHIIVRFTEVLKRLLWSVYTKGFTAEFKHVSTTLHL